MHNMFTFPAVVTMCWSHWKSDRICTCTNLIWLSCYILRKCSNSFQPRSAINKALAGQPYQQCAIVSSCWQIKFGCGKWAAHLLMSGFFLPYSLTTHCHYMCFETKWQGLGWCADTHQCNNSVYKYSLSPKSNCLAFHKSCSNRRMSVA